MLMNFLFWPLKNNGMQAHLFEKVKDQGWDQPTSDTFITLGTFVSDREHTEEQMFIKQR